MSSCGERSEEEVHCGPSQTREISFGRPVFRRLNWLSCRTARDNSGQFSIILSDRTQAIGDLPSDSLHTALSMCKMKSM